MANYIGEPMGLTPDGKVVFDTAEFEERDKYNRFCDVTKEMAATYERKNHTYNDSFGISVRKYGLIAALTRISDKFNRIENLILGAENKVPDESILDSLKDLGCYCVMTIMLICLMVQNVADSLRT